MLQRRIVHALGLPSASPELLSLRCGPLATPRHGLEERPAPGQVFYISDLPLAAAAAVVAAAPARHAFPLPLSLPPSLWNTWSRGGSRGEGETRANSGEVRGRNWPGLPLPTAGGSEARPTRSPRAGRRAMGRAAGGAAGTRPPPPGSPLRWRPPGRGAPGAGTGARGARPTSRGDPGGGREERPAPGSGRSPAARRAEQGDGGPAGLAALPAAPCQNTALQLPAATPGRQFSLQYFLL